MAMVGVGGRQDTVAVLGQRSSGTAAEEYSRRASTSSSSSFSLVENHLAEVASDGMGWGLKSLSQLAALAEFLKRHTVSY